jgi:hypothetical protein
VTYASPVAIQRANAAGLNLSLANWREIFLAITDTMSDERAALNVSAEFVGHVRDGGERWRIKIPHKEFDVIYDPRQARIVLVIRPRDPDAQPAVVPNHTPPLKGVLVDA